MENKPVEYKEIVRCEYCLWAYYELEIELLQVPAIKKCVKCGKDCCLHCVSRGYKQGNRHTACV